MFEHFVNAPYSGPLYTDLIRKLREHEFSQIRDLESVWQKIANIFRDLYIIGAAGVSDFEPLQEVYLDNLEHLQKSGSNQLETTGLIR